jgi:prevent-host-death family protein
MRTEIPSSHAATTSTPATVGIRELARDVSGVVAGVSRSGRAVLVTKHGRPCTAIVPIPPGGEMTFYSLSSYLEGFVAEELRAGRMRSACEVSDALAQLADALARLAEAFGRPTPRADP